MEEQMTPVIHPMVAGLIIGFGLAFPFRFLFGQFTIWTPRRGWVLAWEHKGTRPSNELIAAREKANE